MGQNCSRNVRPWPIGHLSVSAPVLCFYCVRLPQPFRHIFGRGLPPRIVHDLADTCKLKAKAWKQEPFLFAPVPLLDVFSMACLVCQECGERLTLLHAGMCTVFGLALPSHELGSVAVECCRRLEPWEADRGAGIQCCLHFLKLLRRSPPSPVQLHCARGGQLVQGVGQGHLEVQDSTHHCSVVAPAIVLSESLVVFGQQPMSDLAHGSGIVVLAQVTLQDLEVLIRKLLTLLRRIPPH
mmetsp:Transcript_77553/g.107744  ORF Transcript_77553/g.107744 Transcript_77553/m.107744 type:complete len:239 (-) Transcript_77553:48-764(-)